MPIIPVIDLMSGQVVRAIGGRRSEYWPIVSCLTPGADPLDVARALIENFHPTQLYIADLDAIAGAEPIWEIYDSLRTLGVARWIDAGVRVAGKSKDLLAADVEGIVCGLETLSGPDVLREILDEVGRERTIFSLDLRDGRLLGNLAAWPVRGPEDIAGLVDSIIALGVRRLIILDLARVGEGQGTGSEHLCRSIAFADPHVQVYVGGGVRGIDDVIQLERAGAAGVLVASALHDGRIRPFDQKRQSNS